MRVLISAYACEPQRGSESGAGWGFTRAAAQAGHEVWVVTQPRGRHAIADELQAEPNLKVHPVYFDVPRLARQLNRGMVGHRVYLIMWHRAVRRLMLELHERHRFDVAHHVTYATDWLPATATTIPSTPSVWGPIGSHSSVPTSLYRWLGFRGVIEEFLRETVVRAARRWYGSRAARRASLVVAQNNSEATRFRRHASQVLVEPNVAIASSSVDTADDPAERRVACGPSMTALFAGHLVPLKGAVLAIAALKELPDTWNLIIAGNGPERRRCERLAKRLEVMDRVHFRGWLDRVELASEMARTSVLVLPSMHDSAGWVIAEAAMQGTPTVCLDLEGPPTLVARSGGITVNPRGDVVKNLAQAILDAQSLEACGEVWNADRLPGVVDGWYHRARSNHAAKGLAR